MIYTLTMNPAIDYVLEVPELICGGVNRAKSREFITGGKGVNVSRALTSLGVDNKIIPVAIKPRVNVKIRHGDQVTEINGTSVADEAALRGVVAALRELDEDDILIMSGSLPSNVVANFYSRQSGSLSINRGVKVIVDTSGEPLRAMSDHDKTWLLAPNEHELAAMGDVKFNCNMLVSMGEKGAKFVFRDGREIVCPAEKVSQGGYTVGAGDTLLAGFVAEYVKSHDFEKALHAGVKLAGDFVCKSEQSELRG